MREAFAGALRTARLDYLELAKPRLTSFVLIVVFLSGWLAAPPGAANWALLLHAVMGTGLVAAGASAFNMLLERDLDARMQRTHLRPLPSGRLSGMEVLLFGGATSVAGLFQLAWATTPLAATLAALTLLSYVGIYTPLKRLTTLNTHVGAIPGALPALIGWAAVRGELGPDAWALFLIVYVWQIPHFLAIAWMYREDYARGGFVMLPSVDPDGITTGRQAVLGSIALVPVSLLPALSGTTGLAYAVGALALGAYFTTAAVRFALGRTNGAARRLLRASLVYLPMLLALLFFDR